MNKILNLSTHRGVWADREAVIVGSDIEVTVNHPGYTPLGTLYIRYSVNKSTVKCVEVKEDKAVIPFSSLTAGELSIEVIDVLHAQTAKSWLCEALVLRGDNSTIEAVPEIVAVLKELTEVNKALEDIRAKLNAHEKSLNGQSYYDFN